MSYVIDRALRRLYYVMTTSGSLVKFGYTDELRHEYVIDRALGRLYYVMTTLGLFTK